MPMLRWISRSQAAHRFFSSGADPGTDELEDKRTSEGLRSALAAYASRGLLLYLALFIIEVGLFFLVATLPFFPGEQAFYTAQSNQLNNEFQGASLFTQFWGIFTNNFRIALLEMIPGLGVALFGFSLYATARVLEVIANTDNVSPLLVLFLLLLLFPHSWIELPAYAVATGEGLFLLYAIWSFATGSRRINLRDEGWQLAINFIIVAVMLLVAALFESVEIQLGAGLFWITWLPFAGLIALAVLLNKRLMKIKKEDVAELSSGEKMDDSSHLSA
jgi:uncharacterized membrane protein SpoIIM required for sporulation